jgi:hypothetical protein
MKILKTSALAAVLALGSLTANASYSGTDTFTLSIVTAANIGVDITESTLTFDNLIPGDTLAGELNIAITGTSLNTMSCTLDGNAMSDSTASQVTINDDNQTADNTADDQVQAVLNFTIDACGTTASKITVAGSVNAGAGSGHTETVDIPVVVSYTAQSTITGTVTS